MNSYAQDYVISYDMIALLLVGSVLLSYLYRNWLNLKKNKVYYALLWVIFLAISVDMMGRLFIWGDSAQTIFEAAEVATIANLGMHWACYLLYVYYMVVVGGVRKTFQAIKWFGMFISFGIGVLLLTNPWTHWFFYYDALAIGHYHVRPGIVIVLLLSECYLVASMVGVLLNTKKLPKHQVCAIVCSEAVLVVMMYLQYVHPAKWRMSYFVFAVILVMFYLLIQISDQHLVRAGECFTRVGLRKVVEEKMLYEENFAYVSVNINNILGMMNVCTTEELQQVQVTIADCLRKEAPGKIVFQMTESEYVILVKDLDRAKEVMKILQMRLPKVIRINVNSIPVVYGCYSLQFSDVDYSLSNFYRVMAGLHKMVASTAANGEAIYYEGEVREAMKMDLMAVQGLADVLEFDSFGMRFAPIYSTDGGDVLAIDTRLTMTLEEGTVIPEREVWKISEENNTSRKVSLCFVEEICEYVNYNHLVQRGIPYFHINLSTLQISTQEVVDQYCDLLLMHQLRPEQIIFEVFVDQAVSDQVLEQSIRYLKDKGFHVMLDEFGINVCNLKNMLELPFDMVKINANMTKRFLNGRQDELRHLVDMLKKQGWKIYLDGVDNSVSLKTLREMGVTAVQGDSLSPFMNELDIIFWLDKRGGSDVYEDAL